MSTITIASTVTTPVALTSLSNSAVITPTGVVNVTSASSVGIYTIPGVFGTVTNNGTVIAKNGIGISFNSGGTVTNGTDANTLASITGSLAGITANVNSRSNVSNFGTIQATGTYQSTGVSLAGGGLVTNGDASDTAALIVGVGNGVLIGTTAASAVNFGTVEGTGTLGVGVYLTAGGSVVNGSNGDRSATILGAYSAIKNIIGPATVVNYGTLEVLSTSAVSNAWALLMQGGGAVTNGNAKDTTATIKNVSRGGIYLRSPTMATVTNYGTISVGMNDGVYIRNGGVVRNGNSIDQVALITSSTRGVAFGGNLASTVINYGTIAGSGTIGIQMYAGGTIVNGSAADPNALITDKQGVLLGGTTGSTLDNFGTIAVTPRTSGANAAGLYAGGIVVNGASNDATALLRGATVGVIMVGGPSEVINYGTISGTIGVDFQHPSSRAHLTLFSQGTVVDAGTIISLQGTSGKAIVFGYGDERLVLEAGATIVGKVLGGSGTNTMELGSGSGTVYGFGTTKYLNFGTITVDAGGVWTLTGKTNLKNVVVNGPGTLISNGTTVHGGADLVSVDQATGGGGTTLSHYTTIGLALTAASQNPVLVTPMGTINSTFPGQVNGVYFARGVGGTLTNLGQIKAPSAGAFLTSGGTVTNGSAGYQAASIAGGQYGILFGKLNAGTIFNYGTVTSTAGIGALLGAGGYVVNGSNADTTARITSYKQALSAIAAPAVVKNFGTMGCTQTNVGYGIYLRSGGTIINGSNSDTGAYIYGYRKAIFAITNTTTVTNYGTILSRGVVTSQAVSLNTGGAVINGSAQDTTALIQSKGGGAVAVRGLSPGFVANYGTLRADAAHGVGVLLAPSGTVINGNAADTSALIHASGNAIIAKGPGATTVANFGTVASVGGVSIYLGNGGSVVNGSASDTVASLIGPRPVLFQPGYTGTLTNYGTITAYGTSFGSVAFTSGGTLMNGSAADTSALISGGHGVFMTGGPSYVFNYGTITGTGGVQFAAYKSLGGQTWLGSGTLTNAGTIIGTGGVAVQFGYGAEKLIAEPGSVFVGKIIGGVSGTSVIELAAGKGTGSLSQLGGNIKSFSQITVDTGAVWRINGPNTVTAGTTLTNNGILTLSGSLQNNGRITGPVTMGSGAVVTQNGTMSGSLYLGLNSVLQLGTASALSGGVTFGAGSVLELLPGSTATLHGFNGTGIGTVDDNSATAYLQGFGGLTIDKGATVQFSGANALSTNSRTISVVGGVTASSAMTLMQAGTFAVTGSSATALFSGGLVLQGATLSVAAGAIAALGPTIGTNTNALTIGVGNTLSGYGAITCAVTNNGVAVVSGGTLAMSNKLVGTGATTITSGGALSAGGSLGESSTVFGGGGHETVVLGTATGDTTTFTGFTLTDLIDARTVAATSFTFVGGVLSLFNSSNVKVLALKFAGPYTAASFSIQGDGAGGTAILATGAIAAPGGSHVPWMAQRSEPGHGTTVWLNDPSSHHYLPFALNTYR
jgi:hypothetical protein